MYLNNNLTKLSGDASFRKFYRYKGKKKTILVFAEKEEKKNLLIYDAINKIFIKNKINAPRLISHNYRKKLIEIEDLGDDTILKKLKGSKLSILNYYFKVLFILIKLQKIKSKKILTFRKNKYKVPTYTNKMLFNESKLFLDWYVPKTINSNRRQQLNKKLTIIIFELIKKLKCKKNVFVHRDFHISNMMLHKKNIYLIDNQDAVYGNVAYDLASLIDDVRFKTTTNSKKLILNKFLQINKSVNKKKFINDFEILSVLRNLKIIGIFTRLSMRDNKNQYLKLIPHAWKLIEYRINNNPIFKELKYVLDKYFSIKMRKRK